MIVNMHDAKSQLSRLVEAATSGEEVILARAGHPVVRLVPVGEVRAPRRLGLFAGQPFEIAPDFDLFPDELARAFQGEGAL